MSDPIKKPWSGAPAQSQREKFLAEVHNGLMKPCLAASYNLVRDWHLAEECVQDAFGLLWQKLDAIPPDADISRWLFATIRNLSLRIVAKRVRETAYAPDAAADLLDQLTGGVWATDQTAASDGVAAMLDTLPVQERTAFVLRTANDLSAKEIAEVMGCEVGTVHQYVFRARKRLAKIVRDKESGG